MSHKAYENMNIRYLKYGSKYRRWPVYAEHVFKEASVICHEKSDKGGWPHIALNKCQKVSSDCLHMCAIGMKYAEGVDRCKVKEQRRANSFTWQAGEESEMIVQVVSWTQHTQAHSIMNSISVPPTNWLPGNCSQKEKKWGHSNPGGVTYLRRQWHLCY